MIEGSCVAALATALGAAGPLRLVAAWAVCSLVASIVVGSLLHVGHRRATPPRRSSVGDVQPLVIQHRQKG